MGTVSQRIWLRGLPERVKLFTKITIFLNLKKNFYLLAGSSERTEIRYQDIVNKYAADRMAQKYKKAVMKVITILSECRIVSILEVSICSIRFGFWVKQK